MTPKHAQLPFKRRIKDRPFTHAVPLAMFFSALNAVIYFDEVGLISTTILLVIVILGGIGVLTGLQWRGDAAISYIIERTGQFLCMAAWLTNCYILIVLGSSPLAFATPLILMVATLLRILQLNVDIKRVEASRRGQIREARGG